MGYGKVVKKIRENLGLNLRDFEKLTGFSFSNLAKIEKEQSLRGKEKLNIGIDTLKQICDRTGYPFRQFLEEAEYIEPMVRTIPTLSPLQELCGMITDPAEISAVTKYINQTCKIEKVK